MSNTRTIMLSFEEGCHETVEVSDVAPGQYRLLFTPVTADPPVYLGDLIEAREEEGGVHRFLRIVERSGFRTHNCLISREVAESAELAEFAAAVHELGGFVEQIMGGSLIVHAPQDAAFRIDRELDNVVARVASHSSVERREN